MMLVFYIAGLVGNVYEIVVRAHLNQWRIGKN